MPVRIVTVHAIEVTATGGPEVLKYVDTPRPSPGPGEMLIKAEATFVLGAEIGDTVEARDDGVTTLRVGDRVATADAGAAYAEYCIAAADVVALVPDGVTADVAAAAILKGMTAHLLIKSVYPVRGGDTVLLHAGAGGVGLILTQWANQPRRTRHHHGLHHGKGRVVSEGRCRRCAGLSERIEGIRREDPRTHRR